MTRIPEGRDLRFQVMSGHEGADMGKENVKDILEEIQLLNIEMAT